MLSYGHIEFFAHISSSFTLVSLSMLDLVSGPLISGCFITTNHCQTSFWVALIIARGALPSLWG